MNGVIHEDLGKSLLHEYDGIPTGTVVTGFVMGGPLFFIAYLLTDAADKYIFSNQSKSNRNLYKQGDTSKGNFTSHHQYDNVEGMLKALRRNDTKRHLKEPLDACDRIFSHLTSLNGIKTYKRAWKMEKKWGNKTAVYDWYSYQTMTIVLIMAIDEMMLMSGNFVFDEAKGSAVHQIDSVKANELARGTSWCASAIQLGEFIRKNEKRIYGGEFHEASGRSGRPVNEALGEFLVASAGVAAAIAFILWLTRNVAYLLMKMRHDIKSLIETQRKYLEMHLLTNRNDRSRAKQQEYVEHMKRMEKIFAIEEEDAHREADRHLSAMDRQMQDQARRGDHDSSSGNTGMELA